MASAAQVDIGVLGNEFADMIDEFNELMAGYDADPDLQSVEATAFRLETILEMIPLIKKGYNRLNRVLSDEEDQQKLKSLYRPFFDCHIEFVGRMRASIKSRSPPVQQIVTESRAEATEISHRAKTSFPKLPTPTFDGNDDNWVEFKDKFEALIHLNADLSNIEKFHFLKMAIQLPTGMQNVLQSFGMSSSEYEAAWAAVKNQFDDERKLKSSQFKKLFNVKKMSTESAAEVLRIFNTFTHGFTSLALLGVTQDDFQVHLVQNTLDEPTMKDWNKFLDEQQPTWELMKTFLHKQWKSLSSLPEKKLQFKTNDPKSSKSKSFTTIPSLHCPKCNESHKIYQCKSFRDLTVRQRFDFVKEKNLCRNCLGFSHRQRDCPSEKRCNKCKLNHNTLLHFEKQSSDNRPSHQSAQESNLNPSIPPFSSVPPPKLSYPSTSANSSQNFHATTLTTYEINTEMLLSTVCLRVLDAAGNWKTCRALMDSGSQSNFVSSQLADSLGINQEKTFRTVIGVNGQVSAIKRKTSVIFSSLYQKFHGTIDCSVSEDITGCLPSRFIDIRQLKIPSNIFLADPKFNIPGPIDILLGTKWYHDSLLPNIIRQPGQPCLIETRFGWTVGGEVQVNAAMTATSSFISCFHQRANSGVEELDEKLEKFWQVENLENSEKILSQEENYCKMFFDETTYQDKTGRVFVFLPFNDKISNLGSNRKNALRQFYAQEKKRLQDPKLNEGYCAYMEDYEKSGHMSEDFSSSNDGYFLPHHGVVRESSTTTKVRPVNNASCKSETGISLNDALCKGPIVQPDLFDILLRFREGKFVLKSDIEKMFRQIFVDPTNRKFLKILWRKNPEETLRTYQLNTVTFGLKPSPFLATQTLNFLAKKFQTSHPKGSESIRTSFYVDDFVHSFDTFEQGVEILGEVREILSSAHVPTRKWSSNLPNLLLNLPENDVEPLKDDNSVVKTLGYDWKPHEDIFTFNNPLDKSEKIVTKTEVLSDVASFFDPHGIIGPIILRAKLFMKPLRKLGWKEEIPREEKLKWEEFRQQLDALSEIKVSRHILLENPVNVQIHGFADASEEGYGAAIYLRSVDAAGKIKVALLCSKSRVTPPKQQTIARLELCAAVLLIKLAAKIVKILRVSIEKIFLWSDSMITLFWIAAEPSKLSTFVGNRVAAIQELLSSHKTASWAHIRSSSNPADIISRGASPEELKVSRLWWFGPEFLTQPVEYWPSSMLKVNENDPELTCELKRTFVSQSSSKYLELIETRFSKLTKLIHCIAYLQRLEAGKKEHLRSPFTVDDLERAKKFIVVTVQKHFFPNEYEFFLKKRLKAKFDFPRKSAILQLHPFMDDDLILRVGGRVQRSPRLSLNQRHQIILPNCFLTKLIVRNLHRIHLHPGPSAMLSFVREEYWPLKVKSTIREVKHECITCFRAHPTHGTQLMSNLPEDRVKMSPPFESVAVDYAGYFNLRPSLTNKNTVVKCYVAMFKCMCTGAIHLEAVTSLSTPAFIATFDRFVSRRGLSRKIYSDNGTQFVGADQEFAKILKEIEPNIAKHLLEQGIEWIFTTPLAPHAGGYYESGIKTMKQHLVKEFRDRSFDYEQFSTLLCKIEAIINSRPLTPLSNDPDDLEVLTPAHFLIGRPMIAKPERNFLPVQTNRLDKFNQLQKLQQRLWDLWYHDYLHHLQTRPSEFRNVNEYHIGDMVLLKEPNLPPMKWVFGRIVKLFPDSEGIVRRVEVKLPRKEKDKENHTKIRHVRYLSFLPIEKESF